MLRIRTLGGLSVQCAGRAPAGAATQPRRLAVLALVARAGDRGVTREKLLAMLWPDADEEAGRRALSQSLYALRRDLDADEMFLGVQELKLNPDAATCDLLEFESALGDRNLEKAAEVYGGPFLDGFRVPGASEFDRWVDDERRALHQRHIDSLERLARRFNERGDPAAAATWWRKIADLDPLNARVAAELMRSLVAAGDRSGALKHARIYEVLLAQELDVEPDREVVELARKIRNEAGTATVKPVEQPVRVPPPVTATATLPNDPPPLPFVAAAVEDTPAALPPPTSAAARIVPRVLPDDAPTPPDQTPAAAKPRRRIGVFAVAAAVVLTLAAAAWWSGVGRGSSADTPTLAVGRIVDYRGASGAASRDVDAVSDMLATNLARVRGLQVLSSVRLYEVMGQTADGVESSAAVSRAAARAGATEIIEGGLHALADGRLVLDLRRVDLETGAVRAAYRSEGRDVYALVAESTTELAQSLDHQVGLLDPAEVSTKSLVAYRFYEEGMRSFGRSDFRSAERLFEAALAEDSTFAMALFYLMNARGSLGIASPPGTWQRLLTLAERAPDRERLLIRGTWALQAEPGGALRAIADTLAERYPTEVDGPYLQGYARLYDAEYAAAIPLLERALVMDSLGLRGQSARCRACDVVSSLVYAYSSLDSTTHAERLAREFVRHQPRSANAWMLLANVHLALDRLDSTLATYRTAMSISPTGVYDRIYPAIVQIRVGGFEEADRQMREVIRLGTAAEAREARWMLIVSLRYQGRWREALAVAHEAHARVTPNERSTDLGHILKTVEGLVLLESGRAREAAVVWDSLLKAAHAKPVPGLTTERFFTQHYTLLANALAATGDTARLRVAADSARTWGIRSAVRRFKLVGEHATGLLLAARGDSAGAIAAFEGAIYSPTTGFSRTNRDLGAVYLGQRRPADAVRVLGRALRSGTLESGSLYATRTELHELIARAFDDLGMADSAATHYRYVVTALAKSDPETRPRYEAARTRLAALRR